jgi:hypothetical protein
MPSACLTFSTRHGTLSFECDPIGSSLSGVGSSSCDILHVDVTSDDMLFSLSSSTGDPSKETTSLNVKYKDCSQRNWVELLSVTYLMIFLALNISFRKVLIVTAVN